MRYFDTKIAESMEFYMPKHVSEALSVPLYPLFQHGSIQAVYCSRLALVVFLIITCETDWLQDSDDSFPHHCEDSKTGNILTDAPLCSDQNVGLNLVDLQTETCHQLKALLQTIDVQQECQETRDCGLRRCPWFGPSLLAAPGQEGSPPCSARPWFLFCICSHRFCKNKTQLSPDPS